MYTGSADQLRKLERQASNHADKIAELLNRIEDLGLGDITIHNGRITGPALAIRRVDNRWRLDTSQEK